MKADPSFGGGQIPIDTSDGGTGKGAYDSINNKRIDGTYNATAQGEVFDNIVLGAASVAPFTGEVIDFKNTISDIVKGDYGGAAGNAMGFLIPFVPGSVVKAGGRAIKDWIKKNKDTVVDSFKKNKENTIANQMNANVSADDVYYKDLEMRTVPVRGGKEFNDPMGEYNSIKSMHNELPNNVVKPGNPVFNEAGELTGYNMDKVKGVDLDTWMKNGNKLSKEMYNDMVTKITSLNEKGIYHGDLKINNIMIDESGTWKLIDPVGFEHASNMSDNMLKVAKEYDAKALKDLSKYVK